MSTILVLADRHDFLAARVVAALRNAGQPICVLTPGDLTVASAWTHSKDGQIEKDLRPNGSGALAEPRAVLNRLHAARFFAESGSGTAGQGGEAGFSALVANWLGRLGCLVLGPTSGGLLCQNVSVMEWLAAARDAWLPTRAVTLAAATSVAPDRESPALNACGHARAAVVETRVTAPVALAEPVTTMRSVYVVAGQVIGAPDESLIPGLLRLAERFACNLLECHFGWTATAPGRWVFCDGTTVPMDAPAGLLDAIVTALAGQHRQSSMRW